MFFKTFIVFVAAALAKEVIARNVHRHSHQLFHKRADVAKEAIATACIAATAYISETASPAVQIIYEHTHSRFAVKSFEKTALVVSSATPTGAPLTDVVSSSVKAAGGQPTLTATATAPATSSGSSGKRGLAYNDEILLSGFLGIGSKVTWKYNWGQTASTSDGLEFVPMLWGLRSDFTSNWTGHADAALASGSKCLLSFNEPDHSSQANLSVADAVRGHIQYMNPYASRARISTPAITNSGADGQGISWLTEFISKCEGKCALDFAAVHWYSPVDAEGFLQHLLDVHSATNLNVWVTEFAPSGTDEQIDEFLKTVMFAMDYNATFSFVERYSYFMVAPASLISSGTSLSGYGSTFTFY